MDIDRRWLLKSLVASGALGWNFPALAAAGNSSTFTLSNGFRVHFARTETKFISASLMLRSERIFDDGGLGHIMEHTSFVGAAGDWSAREVKETLQNVIQESNARTQHGMIRWDACFLPDYLAPAVQLLALTSLDQKFDVETVASEARVVLQELYLDKYSPGARAERQMAAALYGAKHPEALDTVDKEIAKASVSPVHLAAELREYASRIRLPGNMDLFVAGDIDAEQLRKLVEQHFGRYAFAKGPLLEVPVAAPTRMHRQLKGTSTELTAPLSQIKISWNTGVRIGDSDAPVLLALGDYIDRKLFSSLREEHGDSYTPEANFDSDGCSGIFTISVDTSSDPDLVERRVIATFDSLKKEIDLKELQRFKARMELKRRKDAQSNEAVIDAMVQRVEDGVSARDLHPELVSAEDLIVAARKYLPSYRQGYVRLVLSGQAGAAKILSSSRRRKR